jgi:uncharacterized protein YkwD
MVVRYAIVLFVAVVLAGAAAVGVSAAKPEEAAAASTVTVRTCTGGSIALKAKEKRSLDLHNNVRKSRGLRALCVHPALQRAARAHSADMINRDYFSHGSVGPRLSRFGYNWRTYGENIAWGSGSSGSPDSIFKGWMNSSGHKHNILDGRFREVGIGAVTGNYRGYSGATMWTADFGTR